MAMSEQTQPVAGAAASTTKARTSFGILGAISLSHLLNDMIQSLILAIYPLLQSEFSLTFMQIGMITLTFQLASSLLQPVVGYWTDKYPMPWSLPIGMCFTLSGLVLLALALLELLPVQLSVYMYMLVLHLHIENPLLQPLQNCSYNQVRM